MHRTNLPLPTDRCRERLFAVPRTEPPATPLVLQTKSYFDSLCSDLQSVLASESTAVVATDGSAKSSLAGAAVAVHHGSNHVLDLHGEDQPSFCAELWALLWLAKALFKTAQTGSTGQLVVLVDCTAAIDSVRSKWGQTHPLLAHAIGGCLDDARRAGVCAELA